jgi:hypothetical protein
LAQYFRPFFNYRLPWESANLSKFFDKKARLFSIRFFPLGQSMALAGDFPFGILDFSPWHLEAFPLWHLKAEVHFMTLWLFVRSLALKIGFFIGFSSPSIPDFPLNSISLWGWHDKCVVGPLGKWENGPSIQMANRRKKRKKERIWRRAGRKLKTLFSLLHCL